MNTSIRTVAVIAISFAIVSAAWAQSPGGGAGFGSRPETPAPIETLRFAGGTVVEYVETIRESVPEANFVLMPGADRFIMPSMTLRNISLRHAASLISETSVAPNEYSRIQVSQIGDVFAVQVQLPQVDEPSETFVASLAGIVNENLKPADVLTSIETALDLADDLQPPVSLRFHEATNLLIARGRPSQLAPVLEVLGQLSAAQQDQRHMDNYQQLESQILAQARLINRLSDRIAQLEQAMQER